MKSRQLNNYPDDYAIGSGDFEMKWPLTAWHLFSFTERRAFMKRQHSYHRNTSTSPYYPCCLQIFVAAMGQASRYHARLG